MSKMTDEQIKKALEMCHLQGITSECKGCFYRECPDSCIEDMQKDALDLINRQQEKIEYMQGEREALLEDIQVSSNQVIEQQAEIEKLNVELVGIRGACNSYKMHYDNAKVEIERLQKENKHYEELEQGCYVTGVKNIKTEAIKEYMKILEEKLSQNTDISNVGYQSIIFDMEQGYKEMVGEGE